MDNPSASEVGGGKNSDDMSLSLDCEMDECIQFVHCMGNCTCVQTGTTVMEGEGGMLVLEQQDSRVNKTSTINTGQNLDFPCFEDWLAGLRLQEEDGEQQELEEGHV